MRRAASSPRVSTDGAWWTVRPNSILSRGNRCAERRRVGRASAPRSTPLFRRCRDLNNVALGKVGEPLIVLCTAQFWRKVQQSEEEAAYFLIHEYLHTRGLNQWPHGGTHDSVSITQIVRETCHG
jgi:hypothetical protein